MKKSFSPYRTPSTPFAHIPYTVGFNDFVRSDKLAATLSKTGIHPKNLFDLRKSPISKETELSKPAIKSSIRSPTNSSVKHIQQHRNGQEDKLAQLVRRMVKEELKLEHTRMSSEGLLSQQLRKNPFKEIADLRQDLQSLTMRLQTEKEDRVKVIQGLWHCFNQKLQDEFKESRQLLQIREDAEKCIRPFVDRSLTTFSQNIQEITEEVHSNRQEMSEAVRALRHEINSKMAEKNSQMEVVITSIEHLNLLVRETATEHTNTKSILVDRIEELSKDISTSKQTQLESRELQSQDSGRQLHTFREAIKAEITYIKKTSLQELKEYMERAFQDCETDRMNMKSRLKKLEMAVKHSMADQQNYATIQQSLSARFEAMTQVYNQNFEHLESAQSELAVTVNETLEVVKNLTRTLGELRESTDYSIRSSQTEIANLRNSLVSMTEAKLQSELDAIKGSISGFQLESRKHIPRDKSSELLPSKSLKLFKSDHDIYANCYSDSSLGNDAALQLPNDKQRLTGQTIDTLEPLEKKP